MIYNMLQGFFQAQTLIMDALAVSVDTTSFSITTM